MQSDELFEEMAKGRKLLIHEQLPPSPVEACDVPPQVFLWHLHA